MLAAANLSSCHFAVWTPTRLRLLHRPAWEFSSAASLAQPLRAAIAFSQSDGSSHLHKDGVDLSIQQHFVRSALLDSSAAHRRRRGTDVLLLRKLALLVVMGRGKSFSAADLSIVLASSAQMFWFVHFFLFSANSKMLLGVSAQCVGRAGLAWGGSGFWIPEAVVSRVPKVSKIPKVP